MKINDQIIFAVLHVLIISFINKKQMTIRHKANITQKINDFEVMLSKYSTNQEKTMPPEELRPKSRRIDLPTSQMQENKPSTRGAYQKEDTIKTIDDRINSIMKKHENPIDYGRSPLQPRNNILHHHKKQSSLYQFQGKPQYPLSPYSSKRKQPLEKTEDIKEQCKRLRERSNKIFEQNHQLAEAPQQNEENTKYDQQIKKLNERIKKAEETKKQLNIQFNPFVASVKSKARLQDYSQRSVAKPSLTATPGKSSDKNWQQSAQKRQLITEFKIEVTTPALTPKKAQRVIGIVKNKVATTPFSSSSISAIPMIIKQNPTSAFDSSKKVTQKEHVKELIDALCQQISLDEQFRNNKIWFTFSNEENKWQKLQQKLIERGIQLSSEGCRNIFESSVEQHNPFYRWGNVSFIEGLNGLVNSYQKCEGNWVSTLSKRWTSQQLQIESIKQLILYEQRKEIMTIQDLVCFVNKQTGNYYRNRDLHIIFKRVSPNAGQTLELSSFLSYLTK